jgi:chorismate dehydratase
VVTNLIELKKIRVGIVNYLNTQPMLYGLERLPIKEKIELTGDYPALVAKQLREGEIDLGLIPIASLADLKNQQIVGSYCISTETEAASVAIFSKVPIEKVDRIILDYQSRTSVALAKILCRKYWKKEVVWEAAENETYLDFIEGTTAAVIIGDRALRARNRFEYIYDLGAYWRKLTGLPFVFAAWISNSQLPESFIKEFDEANAEGLAHLEEVLLEVPYQVGYDLREYYTNNMNYILTAEKRKSIQLFLEELSQLPALSL